MCPPALYRLYLAILYVRLPALGCCGRLCLAILCLPALDVASSSFDFGKHKLFGVYGGVICLPGWVIVVGFPAGLSPTSFHLSPTSFHLSPTSFHCLPGWVLVVGFPAGLSPTSFHLSPRLGACGRVPGWLVSHFLSFVSHSFSGWVSGLVPGWLVSHFFSFVSQFFSFVSQAGCL